MLLEVEGVLKRYGRGGAPANDGVNMTVEAGQVYGLLGHNGAGKTTLVNQTVWLVVVLPGVAFAVIIGSIRFGLDLQVSLLVVPAVILVALTATSIGYALASLVPPTVANMASQVLVVFILMFSPLNFPADRLPGWLATLHSVLPIQAMGEVMRGTIASNSFPLTWGAFLLLGVWCVASFATTSLVLTRRG